MKKLLLNLERERHIGGNLSSAEVFLLLYLTLKRVRFSQENRWTTNPKRVLVVKFNAYLRDYSI